MAWHKWLQGLISALANGVITGLTANAVVPAETSIKSLLTIAIVPTIVSFFMYIKQSPPPIGDDEVKP